MGPYGSVWADIKTGKSPMAPDHFKTPPDPKKGHGIIENPQKSKNLLELAKIKGRAIEFAPQLGGISVRAIGNGPTPAPQIGQNTRR